MLRALDGAAELQLVPDWPYHSLSPSPLIYSLDTQSIDPEVDLFVMRNQGREKL